MRLPSPTTEACISTSILMAPEPGIEKPATLVVAMKRVVLIPHPFSIEIVTSLQFLLKKRIVTKVLKEASRLYAASWVRDIGPELRPNDYKKEESTDKNGSNENKEKEPTTLEDLAVAARGGMETLRPALQRLYMTRASAYKDAMKSFIAGYQEGIQQVVDKKEKYESQNPEDNSKKPF
uniref:Uncharacterized protein n=1 Tax=Chenopodium quinoa TaxID=63459 RepID=A0A803L307_CHEQI